MQKGVIYKLTSPSGKAYVGQTKQDVSKRMWAHRAGNSRCFAISSAIAKYGWDSMKLEILLSDVPADELNAKEEGCIQLHGTASPSGYNLNRPSTQPSMAGNHANLKKAVRSYNTANPDEQRVKQNRQATVSKRRMGWRKKREKRYLDMTEKEQWAEYVRCRASAKWAAKQAVTRCAGTGRDPVAEWEEDYGSDTEERKKHVAYQRRMGGRAKGDSSRGISGLHPLASSAEIKGKGKSKQTSNGSGSSAVDFPKSRPSCASMKWCEFDDLLCLSDYDM